MAEKPNFYNPTQVWYASVTINIALEEDGLPVPEERFELLTVPV